MSESIALTHLHCCLIMCKLLRLNFDENVIMINWAAKKSKSAISYLFTCLTMWGTLVQLSPAASCNISEQALHIAN